MKTVSVLMAVYRPNREWLAEQLASIANQTLQDIELLVQDDCPAEPVGETFIRRHLAGVPLSYAVNGSNLGAARTFETLVRRAEGRYFAFCDQDDIWEPQKLEVLCGKIVSTDARAIYCGMSVVDGRGAFLADDVRKVRIHDMFLSGRDLAKRLFVKNCIYGNCLLLPGEVARESLPIPDCYGHDHWATLWAAYRGEIRFLDRPLVKYRLHGNNLSNSFAEIRTRDEYLDRRIGAMLTRCRCADRFPDDPTLQSYIRDVGEWTAAREQWLRRDMGALPAFWRGRRYSPRAFAFELAMPLLPEKTVKRLLEKLSKSGSGQ